MYDSTYETGFTDSSVGKESACNAGDPSLIPGLGRYPGERIGYPLQYFWASLVAQLVKKPPAMQEIWVQSLGWEGNSYPLQYSGLENCTDCIILGVAKSWTQLSDFHLLSKVESLPQFFLNIVDLKSNLNQFNIIKIYTIFTQ